MQWHLHSSKEFIYSIFYYIASVLRLLYDDFTLQLQIGLILKV